MGVLLDVDLGEHRAADLGIGFAQGGETVTRAIVQGLLAGDQLDEADLGLGAEIAMYARMPQIEIDQQHFLIEARREGGNLQGERALAPLRHGRGDQQHAADDPPAPPLVDADDLPKSIPGSSIGMAQTFASGCGALGEAVAGENGFISIPTGDLLLGPKTAQ
jgi:hypothetical protein